MSPSTIALPGALVAVAGGLIAVPASLSAARKRNSIRTARVDGRAQRARPDAPDIARDGGGSGD